jgi:TolA-binding protein
LDRSALERLAAGIESDAAGSAVDAAVFDWRLGGMEPAARVAACAKELEAPGADSTRRGRVALYRRAIRLRESGDAKQAALDLVRLYALHPKAVEEMGAVGYVCGTLKEAGLLLESDLLDKSPEPDRAAAALWRAFSGMGDSQTAAAVYFRHSPDVAAMEQAVSDGSLLDDPFARALYCGRVARIALEAVAPDKAAARYGAFVEAAASAIDTGELGGDDCIHLAQTLAVSHLACRSFVIYGRELRPNLEGAIKRVEPKTAELGRRMLGLYLDARLKTMPAGNEGAGSLLAEVERVVEWADRSDHETALSAYGVFLERYPETAEAPQALERLADYCQVRLRDSVKAAGLYAELIGKYPDAPNVEKAVLRQALALYENKDYRAALDTLTAFIEKKPESSNIATARYMAALAEAALGLVDEAQSHMTSLVNEYPASALAPRALYWLGMNHVTRQEYGEAAEVFRMLTERYPESDYADRARTYIGNLERGK